MKKILHIFSVLNRGGAELRTIELVNHFPEEYQFHFLCLSGKRGELDEKVLVNGGTIHYINIREKGFSKKYRRLIKAEKIDIVHSHVFLMSGYLNFLSRLENVKGRITHFRTSNDAKKKSLFRMFRNFILRVLVEIFSTDILYVSNVAKKKVISKKIIPSKHFVIHNGFKASSFPKVIKEKEFVSVGRFIETKNQIFLLEVLSILKEKYNTFIKIYFVGLNNTEYGDIFKNIIKKKGLEENVEIVGVIENVPEYISEFKYFLFPTKLEGLPGALIEAHLAKCFVINSDIEENIEVNSYFKESSMNLKLDSNLWAQKINEVLDSPPLVNENLNDNPFKLEKNFLNVKNIYDKY
ncbi:glycosyltransferase [Mammaliicoccus sciuri]|uniref:glycosyltransferase n=1 Tax=Mammaliicoccus sciuri TaxID=1296 RepID=UPI002DB6590B|nr:glycosyltransferase [Mammaliicoccus sciuri]MEB6121385.1 glycosyltransferase [Mammaliicoccus sciuri]MEB6286908.1 glycosyltransferase [Mammaliicoccus sciuri]MEB6312362.1 glycosyltransferase [Mammaliicoccus sciuri]MEB6695172.1 glycosyltransferase [Mammaliicoccus sciuri]